MTGILTAAKEQDQSKHQNGKKKAQGLHSSEFYGSNLFLVAGLSPPPIGEVHADLCFPYKFKGIFPWLKVVGDKSEDIVKAKAADDFFRTDGLVFRYSKPVWTLQVCVSELE